MRLSSNVCLSNHTNTKQSFWVQSASFCQTQSSRRIHCLTSLENKRKSFPKSRKTHDHVGNGTKSLSRSSLKSPWQRIAAANRERTGRQLILTLLLAVSLFTVSWLSSISTRYLWLKRAMFKALLTLSQTATCSHTWWTLYSPYSSSLTPNVKLWMLILGLWFKILFTPSEIKRESI